MRHGEALDEAGELLTVAREDGDDGVVLLRLTGEIDTATVHVVEEALEPALNEVSRRLEIDLSGVEFMDSSGLNVLVVARNKLNDRGADLVISEVNDQVRRLFELSGLTTAFTFAR